MSEDKAGMTHAALTRDISYIGKVVAAAMSDLAVGMWNPNFCSANAEASARRFLEDIEIRLAPIRAMVSNSTPPL